MIKTLDHYQTVYELIKSMSINNNLDALPDFIQWLFGDYKYKFSNDELEIYYEFIRQFTSKYLNREICDLNPNVWKSRLIFPLNAYYEYMVKNSETQKLLNTFKGMLNETETSNRKLDDVTTDDYTKNSNNTVDNTNNTTKDTSMSTTENFGKTNNKTRTDDLTSKKTTEATTNITDSNVRTGNEKTDGTSTGKTVNESTTATTDTDNTREVVTDYPQSTVNATTTGNPELRTWKYASGAKDTTNDSSMTSTQSGEADNTNTNTSTLTYNNVTDTRTGSNTENATDTTKNTGTETTVITDGGKNETTNTGKVTEGVIGKTTGTDTTTLSDTKNKNVTEDITKNNEKNMYPDIDLQIKKYDFWQAHKLKPLYYVLDKLEIYFRSMYVDEERYGFMDWTDYTNIINEVS